MSRFLAVLLSAALLAGCASLSGTGLPAATGTEVAACAAWFEQLDAAVDQHHVRDVEADRIAGFAGLRIDRISASLRDRAAADANAFGAWLARLQELDAEGRAVEIGNLPDSAFPLDGSADAAAARTRASTCSAAWRPALERNAALRSMLIARAEVPDRYASWQRAIGLYPLVRWPFFSGVQRWENEHRAQIERWAAAPPLTQRYVPLRERAALDTARWWRDRPRDALGIPRFTADESTALLAAHAPAFEIETHTAADRFGAPVWREGRASGVDTQTPVVYQRIAAMRYRGRVLLQLVYGLWFPERPAERGFDLLSGALDEVLVRITLAPDDGRPLMVDTIHGCGCYQVFAPSAELRLRNDAPRDVEWAYAPITLPPLKSAERIVVRIAAGTHYVVGIARDDGTAGTPYALRDDGALRRLPLPQGGTRSLFGADGLVAGSQRGERLFYWPMGIASAGAMRQWGHHATAFVGRRHFDDADLIERRFEIPALDSAPP